MAPEKRLDWAPESRPAGMSTIRITPTESSPSATTRRANPRLPGCNASKPARAASTATATSTYALASPAVSAPTVGGAATGRPA